MRTHAIYTSYNLQYKITETSIKNKYVYNIHSKITWMEYSEMSDPQSMLMPHRMHLHHFLI
jgi:hypothetical protein